MTHSVLMFANKPVIGLLGGIGSGKSFIAQCFAELGCMVIDSDAQVRMVYEEPEVVDTLRQWWGPEVADGNGKVNRAFIARQIFENETERKKLENLVHPKVNAAREREMAQGANDPRIVAFVWDTPLLLEAGLAPQCDVLVFVDAPASTRQVRVMESRGWNAGEMTGRENLQSPLD